MWGNKLLTWVGWWIVAWAALEWAHMYRDWGIGIVGWVNEAIKAKVGAILWDIPLLSKAGSLWHWVLWAGIWWAIWFGTDKLSSWGSNIESRKSDKINSVWGWVLAWLASTWELWAISPYLWQAGVAWMSYSVSKKFIEAGITKLRWADKAYLAKYLAVAPAAIATSVAWWLDAWIATVAWAGVVWSMMIKNNFKWWEWVKKDLKPATMAA